MDGDALDRELATLADTISVSNPVTYGHKTHWSSAMQFAEQAATREGACAKTLPKTFVLTEPRDAKKGFSVVAAAAKHPVKPLRPNLLLKEDGSRADTPHPNANAASELAAAAVMDTSPSRVPIAKRSHMEGILRGIPGGSDKLASIQQRAFVYDGEMAGMNRDKDTSHHRKRDAYSEYVEARARFSKMHSVN